jgi:hypothetical protein
MPLTDELANRYRALFRTYGTGGSESPFENVTDE